MPKIGGRTDLVCERGENLVKNRFFEILQWIPRKDHPDDGIDLNVEIPPDGGRPCERFLVQVKTASKIKPRRNNDWSASIDDSAARKYLRSRHAVFLLRVDLDTEEIRWIDLLAVLHKEPDRRTFSLPPAQTLDAGSAEAFRGAVGRAIQAQDDHHYPPRRGLAHRAAELEARDPRFAVQGEIVGGVERYTFSAKNDFRAHVKVVPRTKRDAKRLIEAQEFGSKAEIKLRSFRVEGTPALDRDGASDSVMRIEPHSRRLRLGITVMPDAGTQEKSYIELDAELSRGLRGWELRSADAGCPLDLVLQLGEAGDENNRFSVNLLYERWDGRAFSDLPILRQLLALARCFESRGQVVFEWIEFGERRQLLTTWVQADRTRRFKDMIGYLQFLNNLSEVCRRISSRATYNSREVIEPSHLEGVAAAYQLIQGQSVSFSKFEPRLTPTDEGRRALATSPIGAVQLQMPLRLYFGSTFVGEVPVKVTMEDFSASENADGTVTLHPKTSTEMCLDTARI